MVRKLDLFQQRTKSLCVLSKEVLLGFMYLTIHLLLCGKGILGKSDYKGGHKATTIVQIKHDINLNLRVNRNQEK